MKTKKWNENTKQVCTSLILFGLVLCLVPLEIEGRRQRVSGRPRLPIKEDVTNGQHRHEDRRRKASGK